MIVLDWTRPWTFVEELETWLQWIETWAKGDGSREVQIAAEESRERCKSPFSDISSSTQYLLTCRSAILSPTLY